MIKPFFESNRHELSLNQKALWYIHSMEGDAKSSYNEPLVYLLKGYLSIKVLKESFQALINKHTALRISFEKNDEGNLFQVLNENIDLNFSIIEKAGDDDLTDLVINEIRKPFDFYQAPLMRVSLIKIAPDENLLIIVLHHIITDGTSFTILINDLNAFYNQRLRGELISQAREDVLYFDRVVFEKNKFLSREYLTNVDSLAKKLAGFSGLNFLATPLAGEKVDINSGDRVYFTIDRDQYLKINTFSQAQRTTVFHFLFSAYSIFLSQYTRTQDVLIGVPFLNRESDPDLKTMGFFVNILPVRVAATPESNFLSFLSSIQSVIFSYFCNQDVAFEHAASKLTLNRKALGQHPLIQTMFIWGSTDKLKLLFEGIAATQEKKYFSRTSKFDITLCMLEENKETVTGYLEYRTALFERSLIESLTNNFVTLIKNILNNPHELLSSLYMIDDAEKLRMKEKFFVSKLDQVVNTTLGHLFSGTAHRYKNKIGMVFGKTKYNYETLELRSNQWAAYIRLKYKEIYDTEMPNDTLIALCTERNDDMIFGILGILKSGGGYVPIDPNYPQERVNYILNHSQASLLLTHKKHDALNFEFQADHIIYMDDVNVQQGLRDLNTTLTHVINPLDTAYVLYTSGSTGKPKGVSVTHENVICLFESLKKQFDITNKDIWSLFHTYCFDISVWEIWGAFLFGGTLVVLPYEITRDSKRLYQLLESEQVTVLTQTPSAFQMLINEDNQVGKKLEHLRYVAFVGESLKVAILRPWVEKYGTQHPRLANMYGITETTVYTNYKFVDQVDIDRGRDNIGWPLEQFSMCVIDENLRWCPVGIVGEICIGGRGLSRGYLHRDDLTREKFIDDPYASFLGLKKNTLLYRTGDLGRWIDDGSIEYLGRKDFQIKLRGHRIELGEIEAALGSYEEVSHTAVLLKGESDAAYLAAYYTLKPSSHIEETKLIAHLKSFLPEYMIPKTFTELKSFPMTNNGKIDRKELYSYNDKANIKEAENTLDTLLERDIAAIWASILGIDVNKINAKSNFFDLGGNSLLVIKMLTLASKVVSKDLPLSQFIAVPTIATLSAQADQNINSKQNINSLIEQMRKGIILDPAIRPLSLVNPHIFNPENIFLTGATGFLGSHLLVDLLEKTGANVYCLVRATSTEEAMKKILKSLRKYRLSCEKHQARIIPLLGNLTEANLGLSDVDINILKNKVDSIYHVGAWVNHVFDYGTLYKTNVQSVCDLISLAVSKKNKAIHFVSTLGTALISPLERLPVIEEGSFEAQLNLNGYLTTKWVSEQLMKAAYERGIAAHVYRPGNIIAGSHGVYEPEVNHTLLRLKGMLQLKKGYVNKYEVVEMMPVDLLASAIVDVSNNPKLFSYNMNNEKIISWVDYLKFAKNMGYHFSFIRNESVWNQMMNNLDEDNALYKLSHFYKTHAASKEEDMKSISIIPDYIIPTPSYKEMIEQQIMSLIKVGFLERPKTVVKEATEALV